MALELQLPLELEKEALAYAAWQEQTLEGLFTSWLEETIKADQAWYWSEGWQRAEREAEAELEAGRYEDFESMDALLADLMGDF